MLSFARVARVLVVLTALCACSGRGDPDGPLLPGIELPSTTVGTAYETRLTAAGGVPPLKYSVEEVPPGFSFYTGTATLTGPATAEGEYTLTVGVMDAQGAQDSRTYELRVYAAPSISTTALAPATSGLAYEFLLSATGGQPPLLWTIAGGALPQGMTLLAEGSLSGLPQEPGSSSFTVRVQDANGAQATRQLSLEVRRGNTDGGMPDGGSEPDAGTAFPLQVGTWNIEWFGHTSNGPTDEQLQLNNVRTVLQGTDVDLWGVQEIVDLNHFNALQQGMTGYEGFLANDGRVVSGTTYYSSGEQKVGVLYKSDVVTVLNAQIILGAHDSSFAGRPPLRVDLRITRDGATVDLVAIVLHMKAEISSGTEDYDKRKAAGAALKEYLETELPNARVIVLGDWNDDVDKSIVWDSSSDNYLPSPYQNFVDAPSMYTFLTLPLSQAGQGSTVGRSTTIDHHLVTNELAESHVSNSTRVLKPTITDYANTTSDHYPILSRFDFGQVAPP